MCQRCYEEYGSPTEINEQINEAVKLIGIVYTHSLVGGNLHVQLDDWNLDDRFFIDDMEAWRGYTDKEQLTDERKCYKAMQALTLKERATALALYNKCI